jgi:hypothetical protein
MSVADDELFFFSPPVMVWNLKSNGIAIQILAFVYSDSIAAIARIEGQRINVPALTFYSQSF